MKRLVKHIVALSAFVALCLPTTAQTLTTLKKDDNSSLSVRAQARFSNENTANSEASWSRIIYRQIDLDKEQNLPLYYPEEPIEGNLNLFRLVLDLMCTNEVKGYEYLDGRELFSKEYELNMKDMLERFYIPYEEKNVRGSTSKTYVLQEMDVPANEVLSYYIKERWVFDTNRSAFVPTIEAICPVLHRMGDFGDDAIKYPMFWVRYIDLRPHLMQQFVMTSSLNNTATNTLHDFFSRRLFDGEIYKTGNLANKSLMQLYPSDSLLVVEREKIERELQGFNEALWVSTAPKVTTVVVEAKPAAKTKETAPAAAESGDATVDAETVVAKEEESAKEEAAVEEKEEEEEAPANARSSRGLFSKSKEKKEETTSSSSSSDDAPKAVTRSVRRTR